MTLETPIYPICHQYHTLRVFFFNAAYFAAVSSRQELLQRLKEVKRRKSWSGISQNWDLTHKMFRTHQTMDGVQDIYVRNDVGCICLLWFLCWCSMCVCVFLPFDGVVWGNMLMLK